MGAFVDLTGQRFGKLTVIKRVENYIAPNGATCARFECKCDCGKTIYSISTPLRSGRTKSCGCYHLETIKKAQEKTLKTVDGVMVSSLRKKKRKGSKSKYKGVYNDTRSGRWYAQIALKQKVFCLGTYDTEEEAHRARIAAEKILHLPFLIKDANVRKEKILRGMGFDEETIELLLENKKLQEKIEKALEFIEAS